jgi:hypothetical protein
MTSLQLTDKAIAQPDEGLDIARVIGRLTQRIPQPLDCRVDIVIELDNGLVRPQALPNLLTRDYFARGFEEHLEYLNRLLLESNPASLFAQLAPSKV